MYFLSSHNLHVSLFSRVKMDSTNWLAPNVWVFIAQLVEHCSANAEDMGSNPIEVPKLFFSGQFAVAYSNYHYDDHIIIFLKKCIPAVHIIFISYLQLLCGCY